MFKKYKKITTNHFKPLMNVSGKKNMCINSFSLSCATNKKNHSFGCHYHYTMLRLLHPKTASPPLIPLQPPIPLFRTMRLTNSNMYDTIAIVETNQLSIYPTTIKEE